MWGLEIIQLLSFGRQLGLAIMGAAAVWGMVFLYLANKKDKEDISGLFLSWMGLRMRWLIALGGLLSVGAWLAITLFIPASAHEGVTLITKTEGVQNAMTLMTPVYILIIAVVAGILIFLRKTSFIIGGKCGFTWVYPLAFVLASVAISYYTNLRGLPLDEIVFHIFHGFHSILTLGTVVCLDLIFLSTQNAPFVQKHIVPLFPQISKVIWVGLSLDLISTLLIYPEAIQLSPRFYFAQIVVGIIIINGILLSGAISRRMIRNVEEGHKEKTIFWEKFAGVAGAISITSWSAITFVDQFHHMTFSLTTLFSVYVAVIITIIIGHEIWNKLDTHAEQYSTDNE